MQDNDFDQFSSLDEIDYNLTPKQLERVKKSKSSWFCGTTRDPRDMENIQKYIPEMSFYAYIIHNQDDTDPHIHYVCRISGNNFIINVAKKLEVNPQYMQVCLRPRGALRYLIHLDNPDKHQYDPREVKTNDFDFYSSFLEDNQESCNVNNLFRDYTLLKKGKITANDFVAQYQRELAKLNFYQKIKVMDSIYGFSH